jgi:hypothetical protein
MGQYIQLLLRQTFINAAEEVSVPGIDSLWLGDAGRFIGESNPAEGFGAFVRLFQQLEVTRQVFGLSICQDCPEKPA